MNLRFLTLRSPMTVLALAFLASTLGMRMDPSATGRIVANQSDCTVPYGTTPAPDPTTWPGIGLATEAQIASYIKEKGLVFKDAQTIEWQPLAANGSGSAQYGSARPEYRACNLTKADLSAGRFIAVLKTKDMLAYPPFIKERDDSVLIWLEVDSQGKPVVYLSHNGKKAELSTAAFRLAAPIDTPPPSLAECLNPPGSDGVKACWVLPRTGSTDLRSVPWIQLTDLWLCGGDNCWP